MKLRMFMTLALLFAVLAGCQTESSGNENEGGGETGGTEEQAGSTYKVDINQSVIKWTGSKTEEPDTHNGEIKLKSGSLDLDKDGNLTGGSFSIDMKSIINTDEMPEGMQKDLATHLKSGDFFDAEKYTTATFNITESKADQAPSTFKVTGQLKVKDLSKDLTFLATVNENGGSVEASATIEMTHEDLDLKPFPAKITLVVNLVANK